MNKSEILSDIATYEARIKNPGSLSPAQIQVYKNSLAAARLALQNIEGQSKLQTQTQYTATHVEMRRPAPQPKPEAARMQQQIYQQNATTTAPPEVRAIVVNIAGAGTPEVLIEWTDKPAQIVNEGLALSRFKSCVRDLAASDLYRQERYAQLPTYLSWHRAVGYYAALCAFWQRRPTADELEMPRSTATRHLFALIQDFNAAT